MSQNNPFDIFRIADAGDVHFRSLYNLKKAIEEIENFLLGLHLFLDYTFYRNYRPLDHLFCFCTTAPSVINHIDVYAVT